VNQLDFVGAFLQVKMHMRMFVTMPRILEYYFLNMYGAPENL